MWACLTQKSSWKEVFVIGADAHMALKLPGGFHGDIAADEPRRAAVGNAQDLPAGTVETIGCLQPPEPVDIQCQRYRLKGRES
jgi:hypothetical protein